ncbi:hypothetical protein P3T27_002280 [Kitasatospora sp. MAA19]|uniref:hypothetical protein n=1 Tax=Kitasatospora sp. MAA19 TaxID=3035090 RepID=UPI00247308AF|nr:hypothetical protein [Kitasatospora sp. MAA19]MDH6705570.1 hypothetical protein [Kitasatospora sp. MAA19]
MIKRVVVGVAAAALFSLGTGVALANAGTESAAPGSASTSVAWVCSTCHYANTAASGWKGDANDASVQGIVEAWIGHEEHRALASEHWGGDAEGATVLPTLKPETTHYHAAAFPSEGEVCG